MQKHSGNVVSSGTGLIAFFGAFGSPIMRACGWVENAVGLYQFFKITDGINWQPIWAVIFAICAFYLIFNNAVWVLKKYSQFKASRQKDWNADVSQVIRYLLGSSVMANGLTGPDRHEKALAIFVAAAAKGKIKVIGRRPKGTEIEQVTKKDWKKPCRELMADSIPISGSPGRFHNRNALFCNADKNSPMVIFEGLLVQGEEVERLWPKLDKYSHYQWMAR